MPDLLQRPGWGLAEPRAIRLADGAPEVISYHLTNFSDAPEVAHGYQSAETRLVTPQKWCDPVHDGLHRPVTETVAESTAQESVRKPRGRPSKLIISLTALAVIIVIAIIASVTTVVLVKRSVASDSSASVPPPPPPPPRASPSTPSRLTVAGYRSGGSGNDFRYRLYYQTQGEMLKFTECAGVSGQWRGPYSISGTNAAPQTAMAASLVMTYDPPQWEFFWRDTNNKLNGRNWIKPMPQQTNGLEDSINNFPVSMSSTSSIAAYWPYIATQDADSNALRITTYLGGSPGGPWTNSTTTGAQVSIPAASQGSAIAIVPRAATYKHPWAAGLIYRSADGLLAGVSLSWGRNSTWEPWNIAGIPITQTSRIASFAVTSNKTTTTGNNGSSSSNVNTHILYQQGPDGAIYHVSYYDGQWSLPATHAVFSDADPGTDITCLTESLWNADGNAVLTLSSETDMSRCFFWVREGRGIREVLFDGGTWSEVGIVPT